jgi:hypothetical protein
VRTRGANREDKAGILDIARNSNRGRHLTPRFITTSLPLLETLHEAHLLGSSCGQKKNTPHLAS